MKKKLVLLVIGLIGVSLASAPAAGADWLLPASNLSKIGFDSRNPAVAVGPDGTATAVWEHNDGTGWRIQAATRRPGASTFSQPVNVSQAESAERPEVAIGPDGTTTVVWSGFVNSNRVIRASTRAAGTNAFSLPVTLSGGVGVTSNSPLVAVGPSGQTTVVWTTVGSGKSKAQVASRAAGTSIFGSATDLTSFSGIAFPTDVETGPDGRTTVVLMVGPSFPDLDIFTRTRESAESLFGPALGVPSIAWPTGAYADLGVGPDGETTVAWEYGYLGDGLIGVATRPPGQTAFQTEETLSGSGQDAQQPTVAIAPNGKTTVAWRRFDGTNWIVQSRTRPAGAASFLPVKDLSRQGRDAENPMVAGTRQGSFTVAWDRSNGANQIVQAASMAVGRNSFSDPVNLSAAGQDAYLSEITGGPCNGAATAVWARSNGANQIVQQATDRCAGRVTAMKVRGPATASASSRSSYRVTFRNAGPGTAVGLKVGASGKGVKATRQAGSLATGRSKTVRIPLRFSRSGKVKVKVTFTVSSGNAGRKTVRKTVRVR